MSRWFNDCSGYPTALSCEDSMPSSSSARMVSWCLYTLFNAASPTIRRTFSQVAGATVLPSCLIYVEMFSKEERVEDFREHRT